MDDFVISPNGVPLWFVDCQHVEGWERRMVPQLSRRVYMFAEIDQITSGWWFGTFFIFHSIWDIPSHWLSYFSEGLVYHQPDIVCRVCEANKVDKALRIEGSFSHMGCSFHGQPWQHPLKNCSICCLFFRWKTMGFPYVSHIARGFSE